MSPRRWVLAPSITAGFGLALVLLLAAGRNGYDAQIDTTALTNAAMHDRQVLDTSQLVLTRITDAETSQRGYLLTGDESYVAPYEDARRALPSDLAELGTLVSESPEQRRRLAILEPEIAARLDD